MYVHSVYTGACGGEEKVSDSLQLEGFELLWHWKADQNLLEVH